MTNKQISFGTDGVRGKVGEHPITPEAFMQLGYAVGKMLLEKYEKPSVIIGKDTRLSGYIFESSLQAGLLSSGVDVGLLGPMPTPAIAYLTRAYGASSGAVISASHNIWSDNGVKFFSNSGTKFSDAEQGRVLQILAEKMTVDNQKLGKAIRHTQALGRYIEFCKSSFNRALNLNKLKIVLDTANGSTYHLASPVFKELGAEIILINDEPNGVNINDNCGATSTNNLSQNVQSLGADLGIAFDGDGDRVIFIDESGIKVDGDELVFIIAKYYKEQGILNNNTVVGTQMTNVGIRNEFKSLGINFIEAKVGDRFVMEEMQKNNSILGGEGSGHIICANHTSTGDGIIAALQVLEVMRSYNESLKTIVSKIHKYPQILKNVKSQYDLANPELLQAKHQIEAEFKNNGRVLIRKSGTEDLIRVMVEHIDKKIAQKSADVLVKIIAKN
jgi:phosphoglucosamine mutase